MSGRASIFPKSPFHGTLLEIPLCSPRGPPNLWRACFADPNRSHSLVFVHASFPSPPSIPLLPARPFLFPVVIIQRLQASWHTARIARYAVSSELSHTSLHYYTAETILLNVLHFYELVHRRRRRRSNPTPLLDPIIALWRLHSILAAAAAAAAWPTSSEIKPRNVFALRHF